MKTMLFNPYTGTPRHPSDIASDPEGILLLDPDEPVKAAPTGKDSLAVEPDERAMFEAWYMQEYPTLDHAQILTRQRDWTYKFSHVQAIWEAWQARASKGTK